jgi:hypothetical protein
MNIAALTLEPPKSHVTRVFDIDSISEPGHGEADEGHLPSAPAADINTPVFA